MAEQTYRVEDEHLHILVRRAQRAAATDSAEIVRTFLIDYGFTPEPDPATAAVEAAREQLRGALNEAVEKYVTIIWDSDAMLDCLLITPPTPAQRHPHPLEEDTIEVSEAGWAELASLRTQCKEERL